MSNHSNACVEDPIENIFLVLATCNQAIWLVWKGAIFMAAQSLGNEQDVRDKGFELSGYEKFKSPLFT